jgi:oligoendopeptidase F
MPTLARFELETHQRAERGEPLTADSMQNLMADLFTEGFGPKVKIDRPRVGMVWSTFSISSRTIMSINTPRVFLARTPSLAESCAANPTPWKIISASSNLVPRLSAGCAQQSRRRPDHPQSR